MASRPARLVISAVESQDRSFTYLNRLRSVVRPFPSLIEFSTVLLLVIHQPAYRNGSQDHKENVTQGTIIEFWYPKTCAGGLKGGKSPANGELMACNGPEGRPTPCYYRHSGGNANARESFPPDRDSQLFSVDTRLKISIHETI